MNRYLFEHNAFAACEEMRMGSVICPKPRRIGSMNPAINDQIRPIRCHYSHQTEISDSKAGLELMDIIRSKGNYSSERSSSQVDSSPPFFSGSPPTRASNPLVQDLKFGNEMVMPLSRSPLSPSPSSSRKSGGGGCGRMKFGHKPAPIRVEGFDCLTRDGRNCGISAVA